MAQEHADDRLDQGFALNDVVAEFRALRATVLRRWQVTSLDPLTALDETVRFNEVIDQALSESIRQYALRISGTRDRFAGILAHDLRSPLGAITNSAELLMRDESLSTQCIKATASIQRSATRMRRMVDDLLDFTRTRLGDTLPISVSSQDAGRLCSNARDEVSASFPQADIEMFFDGDLTGHWDGDRLSQLVINLLVNAIQHGHGAIRLSAHGAPVKAQLSASQTKGKRYPGTCKLTSSTHSHELILPPSSAARRPASLGLYICKRIAQVAVNSANTSTVFTIRLPRATKS